MIIYNKSGIELCKAHKFTYSGTFMGETYITTTITSEQPIMFGIGAYCEYRGERFECCFQWFKDTKMKANHNGNIYDNSTLTAVSNGSKILK